jgi:hypothetical protein
MVFGREHDQLGRLESLIRPVFPLHAHGRTTLLRMRTPDFKVETIANLAGTRLTGEDTLSAVSSGQWMGIASDGSPVVTRDVGSSEIYALDVKWP